MVAGSGCLVSHVCLLEFVAAKLLCIYPPWTKGQNHKAGNFTKEPFSDLEFFFQTDEMSLHFLFVLLNSNTSKCSVPFRVCLSFLLQKTPAKAETSRDTYVFTWLFAPTCGPLVSSIRPPGALQKGRLSGPAPSSVESKPAFGVMKYPPVNAGGIRDAGSILGWGRSPGEGSGNPLPYSCLGNPMDRGAWLATVHRVANSQTGLNTPLREKAICSIIHSVNALVLQGYIKQYCKYGHI